MAMHFMQEIAALKKQKKTEFRGKCLDHNTIDNGNTIAR
jgi:hypothetical protein